MRLDRTKGNNCLNNIIKLYLTYYPNLRFIQVLWALDIIDSSEGVITDRFYEEPDETIKRIYPRFKDLLDAPSPTILSRLYKIKIKQHLKNIL